MKHIAVSIPDLKIPYEGEITGPDVAGFRERLAVSTGLTGIDSAVLRVEGTSVIRSWVAGVEVPVSELKAKANEAYGISLEELSSREGFPVMNPSDRDPANRFTTGGFSFCSEKPEGKGKVFAVDSYGDCLLTAELCTDGIIRLTDMQDTGSIPKSLERKIRENPSVLRGLIRHEKMYDGTPFPDAHGMAIADLLAFVRKLRGEREIHVYPISLAGGKTLLFRTADRFIMPDVMYTSREGSGVIPIAPAVRELEESEIMEWSIPVLEELALHSWQSWYICAELAFITPYMSAGKKESIEMGLKLFRRLACDVSGNMTMSCVLLREHTLQYYREGKLSAEDTKARLNVLDGLWAGKKKSTGLWTGLKLWAETAKHEMAEKENTDGKRKK